MEWKTVKISDIAYIINGGTPKTSIPEYWDGDIPWLSVKDFNTGLKYVSSAEKHITQEGLEHSATNLLEPEDIIISARGTIGVIAMLSRPMAFNQSCFGLRARNFDAHYLYYLLKEKVKELQGQSQGSVFDTIVRATFDRIECVIPATMDDQRRIAAVLSSLDDKIENNNRINRNLEAQAQALFKSWFVDFEPWGGIMPEDWKEGVLGELCVTNKRTHNGKFAHIIEYIDTGSVTKNRLDSVQILDPNVDKIPSRARRSVTEGDILFSSVRPNQNHYMFLFNPVSNMVASTGFVVITANRSAYRYYVYQHIIQEEIINHLQAIAEQSVSTYPSINASDITNLKIIIPPDNVLDEYAKIMVRMMAQIDSNNNESQRLTALRDTLLPKLMKGEIAL